MSDWQEMLLSQMKFGKREGFYALIPVKKEREKFLADVYQKALASGKKVKIISPTRDATNKFIENVLPANGSAVDLFTAVDNDNRTLDEANVLIIDDFDSLTGPEVDQITTKLARLGRAFVAVGAKVMPGMKMSDKQLDNFTLLASLTPRIFSAAGESKL